MPSSKVSSYALYWSIPLKRGAAALTLENGQNLSRNTFTAEELSVLAALLQSGSAYFDTEKGVLTSGAHGRGAPTAASILMEGGDGPFPTKRPSAKGKS